MTQQVTADRRDHVLDELVELFLAEGFLRFGVGDLATRLRCSRSTLYLVASSKEQIIRAAVRRYFRRAAERIEARVAAEPDAGQRLVVYLHGVAKELAPASEAFYADLAAHPPAAEVYEENTRAAARRVAALVEGGVGEGRTRPVDAAFVGTAVAQVMSAIQAGRFVPGGDARRDDASSYVALADLVVNGLTPNPAPGPQ